MCKMRGHYAAALLLMESRTTPEPLSLKLFFTLRGALPSYSIARSPYSSVSFTPPLS